MTKSEKKTKQRGSNCETCEYYVYDDLMDWYVCEIDLDQDEMEDFLNYNTYQCPYYRYADAYYLPHKQ